MKCEGCGKPISGSPIYTADDVRLCFECYVAARSYDDKKRIAELEAVVRQLRDVLLWHGAVDAARALAAAAKVLGEKK